MVAIGSHHRGTEIDVEGHAQKPERDTGAANVPLGGEAIVSEGEGRVGRGRDRRQGDEVVHARRDDRVDS